MRRSLLKSTAAWVAAISLLFSQLAVVAYACPTDNTPLADLHTISQASDCCREDQTDTPSLCSEHCKGSKAIATDAVEMPLAAAFTDGLRLPLAAAASALSVTSIEATARTKPPPIAVLHCCFRI
jgi:hypothetical protein